MPSKTIFGRRQLQRCRRLMPSRHSGSRDQLLLSLVFSDIRADLHVPEHGICERKGSKTSATIVSAE